MCVTCITTMLPTAAAACAALGEGGSPCGFMRSHFPLLTSMMCTSLVAPASRIPEHRHDAFGPALAAVELTLDSEAVVAA